MNGSASQVPIRLEALRARTADFPTLPGVYIMKDAARQIIYVGKAINLRARVRQYFGESDTRYQIRFLMQRLHDLDFIVTRTETEALLLENSLIKKHRPRYNVFLKDDKTYLALRLSIKDTYPRLTTTRKIRRDGALYFGPFTHAEALYNVKEFLDQYFMLRSCSDHELGNRVRPCLEYQIKRCSAPCVELVERAAYAKQVAAVRLFLTGKNQELHQMVVDKMQKASTDENFEEAARLRDLLEAMQDVLVKQRVTALSFDFLDVIDILRQDDRVGVAILMVREGRLIESKYAVYKSLEDDEAFLANFILQYYSERSFIPTQIILPVDLPDKQAVTDLLMERSGRKIMIRAARADEHRDLIVLARENLASHFKKDAAGQLQMSGILKSLQEKLDLQQLPEHIECYDISNISGTHAVGSMVVFRNGEASRRDYRHFRVRGKSTPDDFAMMLEVLGRRFAKKETGLEPPHLLIVDGGRGQLNVALKVLDDLQIKGVDVIGIAKGQGQGVRAKGQWDGKKEEEIYLPHRKNPVILRRGSPETWLLQRIRDEAHRFAITYHRKLRTKALTTSFLDAIPGIGAARKRALLKKFGSASGILKASKKELMEVRGISSEIVDVIFNRKPY